MKHLWLTAWADIIESLEKIPANSKVIIDCTRSKVIDYDIHEVIENYLLHANLKVIDVELLDYDPNL